MIQELFTERYRPQNLDQTVLPSRIRKAIGDGKLHQNYLFYGPPGLGKTSLARVLAKGYPTLYINVSDESSVEVIREKITNWCSTISLLDGAEQFKVVILDEMDGASDQFYKALRATIEKFAATARFIGTCNYINKVPDPIQSRFTCINFDFVSREEEKEVMLEFAKRAYAIFLKSNITISKEALAEFVKRNFPDMRTILNKIQTFVIQGVTQIEADDVKKLNYSFRDVFELVVKSADAYENYKFLMTNYASKVDDVLAALGNELPEYIRENHPQKTAKIPQILVTVANHQAQRVHVIDPAVTMLSAVFSCQMIINS
jgi:DNA polymerase III delta prime subunit